MGSAVSITASILAVNGNTSYLLCSTLQTKAIDCAKATVKGQWWAEPYICSSGICYRKWSTAAEAGDSAIQFVEVEMEDGESYWLSGTLTDYTTKCNACCGATPVLTPIAIPAWVPCTDICADSDGNYVYGFQVQTLASGQTYTASLYADGVLVTTSGALANPAAVLAYAQANWSAAGTWTLVGNTLILTSTTVTCATLIMALVSHSFCITVAYPFTFDALTRSGDNGVTETFTLPAAVTVANNAGLDAALSSPIDYFSDGAVTHATAGKVMYVGTGRPFLLKNNGSTVGTWTTAACS